MKNIERKSNIYTAIFGATTTILVGMMLFRVATGNAGGNTALPIMSVVSAYCFSRTKKSSKK